MLDGYTPFLASNAMIIGTCIFRFDSMHICYMLSCARHCASYFRFPTSWAAVAKFSPQRSMDTASTMESYISFLFLCKVEME